MPYRYCCVKNCNSNTKFKDVLHSFPTNPAIKKLWCKKLFNIAKCNIASNLYVCGKHFETTCYYTPTCKKLKPNAVPTRLGCNQFFSNTESPALIESTKPKGLDFSQHNNYSLPFRYEDTTNSFQFDAPHTIFNSDYDLLNEKVKFLDTIQNLENKLKEVEEKYKSLNRRYNKATEKLKNKTLSQAQECIVQIEKDANNSNASAIFLLDQIYNYSYKRPKWDEHTVRQCIAWRYVSPKGYEFARRSHLLKAPSKTTLNRYMGNIHDGKNLSSLIESRLLSEASKLNNVEKICSLILDDMAIKEKLHYSRSEDVIHGISTVTESSLGIRPILANKLLCFVIHGMTTKYTIPVGYFFHKTLSSDKLYDVTLKVIHLVHKCGFKILRLVSDNHKSNVALFKLFGNGQLQIRIPHPVNPEIPLFFSFDYCHAIKNARNLFLDHNMASTTGIITADYLRNLYNIQRKFLVKPVPFLTRKHLFPNNLEKMNVLRAVQIFSQPIIASLKYLVKYNNSSTDFKEANATIEYLEAMNIFFKLHDISDKVHHFRQLDSQCAPYTEISDERLLWLSETFPNYIRNIQKTSKECNLKGLTKETAEALVFTAKSTSECIKYLLSESSFYYVLTRTFSSDAIESMFSNIRMRGGSHDATDAQAAHYALKQILKSGIINTSTSANISKDDVSFVSRAAVSNNTYIQPVSHNLPLDLPESVNKNISDLKSISNYVGYGILSASTAMFAGYIIRTLEERIHCSCIENFCTSSACNPLLGLIYLQDNGSLKYPNRYFTSLIYGIVTVIKEIIPYLPQQGQALKIISSLLKEPLQTHFSCVEHGEIITDTVLTKLIKPLLTTYCNEQSDFCVTYQNLTTKPLSRKVLKL